MDKFLGAMLWGAMGILVVGGLFALWPWLMAARNWSLNRTGYKMAQNGNKEGGIALMAAARGLTKFSEKHREKRHALAEKFGWSKPVEHVPV